jgi:hypothetical protein
MHTFRKIGFKWRRGLRLYRAHEAISTITMTSNTVQMFAQAAITVQQLGNRCQFKLQPVSFDASRRLASRGARCVVL